ncbi:MAG: hypothetical protein LQ346_000446 [Caloplaca aetnensis]|nr:MAG: hypothetical protein LQ346_000446 [Caloplaca aetnensis]
MPEREPFGLGLFLDEINHFKSHTSLENYGHRFRQLDTTTFFGRFLWFDFFFTTEPENIKSVLATDFKSYGVGGQRKKALKPLLGEGIFTTDGAAWQQSRELLRPCFARSQIGDRELFEKHVQNLLCAIPRDGSTIDLQSLFFKLTLDVATEFLFGASTYALDPEKARPEDEEFIKAFNFAQNPLESQSVLSLFLPNRRFKRSCKYIHSWVDELVERALVGTPEKAELSEADKSAKRYVLLQELASRTSDKVRIRTELLNMLLAGRDTTAALLSNAWLSISKNPRVWSRLQHEVNALEIPLGKNRPLFEELKEMKYLRATLNESLRIHPVVPVNSREAMTDTALPLGGGRDGKSPVYVPKGTIVNYGVHAMHHREDLFGEDAHEFRPERWIDHGDKKGLRVGWEYLPFNGGPRICIGQQFALTEAAFVSVRLLQKFDRIESRDSEPWREKISLTCASLNGCKKSLGWTLNAASRRAHPPSV